MLVWHLYDKSSAHFSGNLFDSSDRQRFEVFATDNDVFAHQLNSLKRMFHFQVSSLDFYLMLDVADLALEFVKSHKEIPIVLDPVLVCKEKHDVEVSALRDELLKFSHMLQSSLLTWFEADISTNVN